MLLVLALCAGCGRSAESDPTARRIAKIGDGQIDIIVNGDKLAILSREQLRAGIRIDQVLATYPYPAWSSITAYGPGAGPFEWLDPAASHAGKVPIAFLDGDRGALALVDPMEPGDRDGDARFDGIDEIRITIPPPARTPLEQLAAGCAPPPRGERPALPTVKHWRGSSYQFNIPMHWNSDLDLSLEELVASPIGTKVGTIVGRAVEWEQVCHADLFRIADRNGRRAVVGRVPPGELCVDAIMELACDGTDLKEWAYYAETGVYVEVGTLQPVP
jgi:hypothetical protein